MQPFNAVHTPIIDTHLHLWDMKQFRPPWLSEAAEVKIRKPCTLREYEIETKGLNIAHAVYMEIDINAEQQVEEADWISEMCHSGKTKVVKAVVSGRPADPKFRAYARRYKNDAAITGFRQVLQVPDAKPGLCLTKTFVDNIRYLGSIGKTFDFCIRPGELQDAMKLARLCPETRFVLDHCGNAAARNANQVVWESDIREFAQIPNVV
jgi:predicted TIM-barrel fold metal-dependent hydrolase